MQFKLEFGLKKQIQERRTDFKLEQYAFLVRDEDDTGAENINTHSFESFYLGKDSGKK